MSKTSLIAAVDENFGLGFNNQLLCHLPADLKFFKETTLGKPIIMGKKTFESIGRPLPGRQNIVLSTSMNPELGVGIGVDIASSLSEAIALALSTDAKDTKDTKDTKEIMIIGGALVFQEALPLADTIYLTHIHHTFKADVFFPNLDPSHWECTDSQFRPKDEKNPYDLTLKRYQRR